MLSDEDYDGPCYRAGNMFKEFASNTSQRNTEIVISNKPFSPFSTAHKQPFLSNFNPFNILLLEEMTNGPNSVVIFCSFLG